MEGKPRLQKPGQMMPFSVRRRIVYERETQKRKPTAMLDAWSSWHSIEVQRSYVIRMDKLKSRRDIVLPVKSRLTGRVPALGLKAPTPSD